MAHPRWRPASSRLRSAETLPVSGRRDHLVDRGVGHLGGHQLEHAARRGVGLQTAPAAAPAYRTLLVDGQVADLTRRAAGAAEELVVDDDPRPDAGGELEVDRRGVSSGHAHPVLGQGAEVGVVLDVHRAGEVLLGDLAGVDPDPAGKDG